MRNPNTPVGFGIYIDAQAAPQAAFSQFVGALNSHADSKPDFFSLRSLNLQFATAGVQSLPASLAPTTPGATMAQGLTVTAVAQISASASSGVMRTLARLVSGTGCTPLNNLLYTW